MANATHKPLNHSMLYKQPARQRVMLGYSNLQSKLQAAVENTPIGVIPQSL